MTLSAMKRQIHQQAGVEQRARPDGWQKRYSRVFFWIVFFFFFFLDFDAAKAAFQWQSFNKLFHVENGTVEIIAEIPRNTKREGSQRNISHWSFDFLAHTANTIFDDARARGLCENLESMISTKSC